MQVMFQHVSSPAPKPSESGVVAVALDAPVLHMLEKSPAARPASCAEAVEAIAAAAAAAGHSIGTLPTGTPLGMTPSGRTPTDLAALAAARTEAAVGPSTFSAAEAMPRAPARSRVLLLGAGAAVLVLAIGGVLLATRSPTPAGVTTTTPANVMPSAEPSAKATESAAVEPMPTASAPALTRVRVTIESEPKRVEVFLGERKLGVSPDEEIRLDKSDTVTELTLRADGYLPAKIKVKPSADAVVSAKLVKKAAGPSVKRPEVEF